MSKVYEHPSGMRYKVVTIIREIWTEGQMDSQESSLVVRYDPEVPDVLITSGHTSKTPAIAERNLEQIARTQNMTEVIDE